MTNLRTGLAIVTLAAALASTSALAQMHKSDGEMNAGKAYMGAHQKMMTDMNGMKPTADADKDFALMMIPHHQGAIDMAEVELKHGKDPELRKMAQKIIDDQKKEIADFKRWLSQNK